MTDTPNTKQLSVQLPPDLVAKVDAVCRERMIGRALLVQQALQHFLPLLPPVNPLAPPPATPPA